jgi:hypothetical protein
MQREVFIRDNKKNRNQRGGVRDASYYLTDAKRASFAMLTPGN